MSKENKSGLEAILTEEQLQRLKEMEKEEDIEISNHRKLSGVVGTFVIAWAVLTSLLHIWFLLVKPIDPLKFRALHVVTLSVLGFILVPGWEKAKEKVHILDWLGAAASIGVYLYMMINFDQLIWRIRVRPTNLDVVMAIIGIIIVLELARRCSGPAMVYLGGTFLAYGLVGKYLPGILGHSGYAFKRLMGYMYSDYAIFSDPIAISSRYIILFIIFASFLTVSGVGKYFVEWAFAVSGHARGGPAKVAVIASALMGTMNGTSAGNAVATGSFTIPLMKKVGYSPTFAAATEAVASSGGQIMPPIMGAGIFLMAEITGIPYQRIMFAGIVPAVLYFFSCFMMVDLEAVKLRLTGFPRSALPNFFEVMKRGYLFLPVVALFGLLLSGRSVISAGGAAIATSFLVSWVNAAVHKDVTKGMDLKKLISAFEQGARGSIQLMAVCATAGIVCGIISLTGLGVKFANLLLSISGTSQLLALVFTMCVCILLGMGMPTTAAYAIAASVLAPGLIRMGLSTLVAHMFIFYFACMSAITPPVALASYAASGISGSDPMQTGWMSFRMGIPAFIVPYMFYYVPAIILGTEKEVMMIATAAGVGPLALGAVIMRSVTALIGVLALVSALQGQYFGKLALWQQVVLAVVCFFLVSPVSVLEFVGLGTMLAMAIFQKAAAKKDTPASLAGA